VNQNITLTIVATNTQFNGFEFVFTAVHQLPLAFMQIFGGPTTATITATATSIVGNQRQSPALLTLSSVACATHLQGSGSLTVLGDVYTNGTACVDANLHLAGNCYGQTGSNCTAATYYCYNATPGFVPYDPNGPPPPAHPAGACAAGDLLGNPVVPSLLLPNPGYLAPSVPFYSGPGGFMPHGSYTELTPGIFGPFALSGPGCYFLDPGVYQWTGGYFSHGGMVSNELKAPDEELYTAPGSPSQAGGNAFWVAGGCAGSFTVAIVAAGAGQGLHHNGAQGPWGVEVTAVRYDRFLDNTILPDPCLALSGCLRESAPSACHETANEIDGNNSGIAVNITTNSPGAQYYNVYVNPNGCVGTPTGDTSGTRANFTFVNTFPAPVASATLVGGIAGSGWSCGAPLVTVCNIAYNNLLTPGTNCNAQARNLKNCQAPDDETAPTCFSVCPPTPAVPQENNYMSLEYPPFTGGDIANENYCRETPASPGGLASAPCATSKITPGAVQFYMPIGSCLDQNGGGYTHVFSGEQYNWIVIYQQSGPLAIPPNAPTCSPNKLDGNALTQYIGTIYSPSSDWIIQGSDKSPLAGQVICSTATVTGAGQAGIDYNPNYAPAPPAARLIN
jgi:hypothetical protein